MANHVNRRQFVGTSAAWLCAGVIPGSRLLERTGLLGAAAPFRPSRQAPPFVVDMHVHMDQPPVPTTYRDRLFEPFKAQYDGEGGRIPNPRRYSYLPEQIVERMDEAGVDVSFVMIGGGGRRREGRDGSYEFLAEQVRRYPDRLVGMPSYDPLYEPYGNVEFVEFCAENGFPAIKFMAPYEEFSPYDERIWPLYEKATELGVTMTFHTGWVPVPPAANHWAHFQLDWLDKLGTRFPDLHVHMAHAGMPDAWERAVLVAAKHDNFSLDFSSWCAYPPHYLVGMLALARDVGGIDKVMFGSEHSVCDPKMFVEQVLNINLWAERLSYPPFSEEEIRGVLGLNAARWFDLSTEKRV